MKKSFWHNHPPIIECDKPQGTVHISSEASVTISLEKWDHFFRTWEFVENTFFWKKGKLSSEEKFLPILPSIIESDKPHGLISFISEASVPNTVERLRQFLQDLRACWKHKFWEKGNSSSSEKTLAFFSYIRVWQTSGKGF